MTNWGEKCGAASVLKVKVNLRVVEKVGEDRGTFLESLLVTRVHHKDKPMHLPMMMVGCDDNGIMILHLVIVFRPNASEAFAAAEIIDCHMKAFVPDDTVSHQ